MAETAIVAASVLESFLARLFRKLGMTSTNAAACASDLTLTNLWGIDGHGVLRFPVYARRLKSAAMNANPEVRVIDGRGAFQILDGGAGMGFLVGHHAMALALESARGFGIGAVSVRNSNHFGAAALYVKQAADAGFMSFCMTNVQPNVLAPNGAGPVTGNNPIAFGAPTRLGFPFMLDISMSAVSGGKLLLAREKGESIAAGLATDRHRRPTKDPAEALAGYLLPFGMHKGFGLALVVDLLCGVISGGAYQHGISSMYSAPDRPSDTSHMMIAIDPCLALEREDFLDRMDRFYHGLKSSPKQSGSGETYLPGEIEHECKRVRAATGIPLPRSVFESLNIVAAELDTDPLSELAGAINPHSADGQ